MTTVRDITDEWVLNNFDINKERKEKLVENRQRIWDVLPSSGGTKVGVWITELQKKIDDLVDTYFKSNAEVKKFRCNAEVLIKSERYYYDCYSSDVEFEIIIRYERPETDKQVVSRLKSREKQKIKKANEKTKKEDRERQEYERLKRKFEK